MLFTYNLQMFADEIPGIDADVLEQFKDELPNEESEQQPSEEETAAADTHSDNKEVEGQESTEEEEPEEGSPIPYGRFKSVNDRMKTSEARVKELEAELAQVKSGTAPQEQAQQASPAPEAQQQQAADDFNAQQIKLMAAEARKRAAQQLQLSDEDIENMEYQDDPNIKASYDALTAQYMGEVKKEVVEYRNQQIAYVNDINTTNANYRREVEAFKADPEYEKKWAKVCEAAQARGQSFLMAAQGAIDRLDKGSGTSGDFYFVKMFMDSVLADYKSAAPTSKPNKKITEAAKLPTAPSVGGSTKGDVVWDVATITDYVNRGKLDDIPKDVLAKVMGQSIAPGDQEE